MVVKLVLKALSQDFQDQLGWCDGVRGGEKISIVGMGEGRELVVEDPDGPGRVSSGVPDG
jgi:hypothetical protein